MRGVDPPARPGVGADVLVRMAVPVGRTWQSIAAGYVGLLSPLVLPAPFAVILGVWALVDLRRKPDKHGRGRAIFAIVMGLLVIGLVVVLRAAVAPGPAVSR